MLPDYNQNTNLLWSSQYVLSFTSSHINFGQQIPCQQARSPDTYVPAMEEDLVRQSHRGICSNPARVLKSK